MLKLLGQDVSHLSNKDLEMYTEYILQQLNKVNFHKKDTQTPAKFSESTVITKLDEMQTELKGRETALLL